MRRTTQRGSSRSISALGRCQEDTCQFDCPGKPPLIFGSTPKTPLIGIQGEEKRFAEPEKRTSDVRPGLAKHVAPLGWEHIGLTGEYVWSSADQPLDGSFRPQRRRDSILAA